MKRSWVDREFDDCENRSRGVKVKIESSSYLLQSVSVFGIAVFRCRRGVATEMAACVMLHVTRSPARYIRDVACVK